MNEQITELLQLYENTLSIQGVHRREEPHTAQSGDLRLAHARWMIDDIKQNAVRDKWPEQKLWQRVGIVQGILWSENVFSMVAIDDQNRPLFRNAPAVSTAPVTKTS